MQTVYARDNWGPRKEAAQDTAHDGNFDLADRKLQRAYCNYSRVTPYTSASCALLFELAPETLTGWSAFPQIAYIHPVCGFVRDDGDDTTTLHATGRAKSNVALYIKKVSTYAREFRRLAFRFA
uniref:Uncharacterized protein n=1 Tax=Vespula pensylvanica TaxID=30213 RepID=A0A834KQ04_VESPE|nr:hypothetical protein H0235_013255 [Vespula pensylvanica]